MEIETISILSSSDLFYNPEVDVKGFKGGQREWKKKKF